MRVYEFSKENGIPTKELLEVLKKEGFEVKSHMSVLTPEELDFLVKKFKSKTESAAKKITPAVSEKKVEEKHEKIQTTPKSLQKETPKKMHQEIKEAEKQATSSAQPIHKPVAKEQQVIAKETQIEKKVISEELPPTIEIAIAPMMLADAAHKMGKSINDIILTLLKWGIISNKNQIVSADIIARLAEQYQLKVIKPTPPKKVEISKGQISVGKGEFKERLPVIVVLGHVDHGKTTLLDFIRKTRVAAKEKGGITQHIGAYEAQTPQGNIVFLDTPGHEAFSKMRMRGIKVADIAILVVAADDGIMPQTIESIKLAKSMEVPIVAAINKIDKVESTRLEIVKRQLAQHDLLPEEWGGQVIVVPISAKEGKGIDQLLEMILLQAQLMELKADVAGPAKGYVIEAKIEKGRGPVATLICQHGVVKIGDYFRCGNVIGRVSSLVNSFGQRLKEVGASIPVQVAGFEELPEAGDYFEVVSKEQQRKAPAMIERKPSISTSRLLAKEEAINLLIKADTNSSKEALIDAIEKLSKKTEKGFAIIFAGVGDVSESDVILASNTNSRIITLHAKVDPNVTVIAQHEGVRIFTFDIIYKLLESLEEMAEQAKEIKYVRKEIGEAIVLRVFDIKNVGVIAGAQVREGRFSKDGTAIVWRGNKKIGEGKILSLQRDKKTVKEVHTGFECAFLIEGLSDFAVDDRVECFLDVPENQ
jgi:translation initiation factor IF-2